MFPFFNKKNSELETILQKIQINQSNNYKDAAQENLKEFQKVFEKCLKTNQLNEKQKEYYKKILSDLIIQMKNYTHKDQKVTW